MLVASCADEPTRRVAGPDGDTARAAPSLVSQMDAPGASVSVRVEVPASMRSSPFNVDRYLNVPPNFSAQVYARVPAARFMATAPNGDLLVSRPGAGRVVRVRPNSGGDPTVSDWLTNLRNPHDIVFHTIGGVTYVYVAESHQINRYVYNAADGSAGARQIVIAGLPDNSSGELQGQYGHQLKNIALEGNRLYVSIASPSNADPADLARDPKGGAVYLYDAAGGGRRLFAQGLRNAEGLAIAPGTTTLWVVVNNRDNIAYPFHNDWQNNGTGDDYGKVIQSYVDDHPPEEFTAVRDGGHYGWPLCNPNPDTPAGLDDMPFDRDVQNNGDGSRLDCATADRVSKGIQAHSAPLGLTFWTGAGAPADYRGGAVVPLHGSWNRSVRTGYKIAYFPWNAGSQRPGAQVDLVTGWLTGGVWGRPVDAAVAPDGGLYLSDDYSGTIYKLTYTAPADPNVLLVNRASSKCATISNGSQSPGAQVINWPCHGGANQRWTVPAPGASGPVRVYGTMCLAPSVATSNSTAVIATCTGAPSQQWTLAPNGQLRLADGRCLALNAGRTTNGTLLLAYTCGDRDSQKWNVEDEP